MCVLECQIIIISPMCFRNGDVYVRLEYSKLSDKEWIEKCVKESQYIGSDAAFANIYLLRSKYNIKVTYYKDLLIRYYEGLGNRKGYTFPLGRKDVLSALYAIEQDAFQI